MWSDRTIANLDFPDVVHCSDTHEPDGGIGDGLEECVGNLPCQSGIRASNQQVDYASAWDDFSVNVILIDVFQPDTLRCCVPHVLAVGNLGKVVCHKLGRLQIIVCRQLPSR